MTVENSLTDLARLCFMAVGPSRIAICALLVLCDDDETALEASKRWDAAATRIHTAEEMLRVTFPKRLATTDHEMSEDLAAALTQAHQCLAPIMKALTVPPGELCAKMGGHEAFRDYFFEEAEPTVTDFLNLMTEELTAARTLDDAAHRTQALRSIDSANGVGRAMSLIAVNAAIEASRSGNKGFRVIADEIKSLAGQTQTLLGEVSKAMMRQN